MAAYVECKIHPSLAPLLALINVAGLCYFFPTLKPFPNSTHTPPPPDPCLPNTPVHPLTPDRRVTRMEEKEIFESTFFPCTGPPSMSQTVSDTEGKD